MFKMDPVNNRADFKNAVEKIASWKKYISLDEVIKMIIMNEPLNDVRKKIDDCQAYIDSELSKWDAATTEQERKEIVGKVKRPEIS